MKQYSKYVFLCCLVALIFGCKKDEKRVTLTGGNAPVLTSSVSGTIDLYVPNKAQDAVTFRWTNPNYMFTTGVNSQDVSYTIQFDTVGSNFTNPAVADTIVSNDLSVTMSVKQFNGFLSRLEVADSMPHDIQVRVVASINGAAPLPSSPVTFTAIKPYEDFVVRPPAVGTLYITGSATPKDWMSGGDAPVASQQFTKVKKYLYVLDNIRLTGGGSYLFVPRYGNWSAQAPDPEKYGGVGQNNTNDPKGDKFKPGGGDLKAPGTTGNYKIEVNFKTGKFTVTAL